MRLRIICALALVGLAGIVSSGQQPPPRPRLVLVLSIDQIRFDYLTRFQKLYTGGLKTLTEGGRFSRTPCTGTQRTRPDRVTR
jgi:predicted AlkP superfamily pyrophosphatase or phosphodiesterase